jgi:hypothetical protein
MPYCVRKSLIEVEEETKEINSLASHHPVHSGLLKESAKRSWSDAIHDEGPTFLDTDVDDQSSHRPTKAVMLSEKSSVVETFDHDVVRSSKESVSVKSSVKASVQRLTSNTSDDSRKKSEIIFIRNNSVQGWF